MDIDKIEFIPISRSNVQTWITLLFWRNSASISQYMYQRHQITLTEHFHWLSGLINDHNREAWVVRVKDKEVGFVTIRLISALAERSYDWGFYTFGKAAEIKGLGRLIEFGVLEYLFTIKSAEKIICEVYEKNSEVINLHRKFMFKLIDKFSKKNADEKMNEIIWRLKLCRNIWDRKRNKILEKHIMRAKIYREISFRSISCIGFNK
jgi:UDP-4-amino-4,6-dideoxy-N-acetyl-beta-L-altrosamine N-acetyltransferase